MSDFERLTANLRARDRPAALSEAVRALQAEQRRYLPQAVAYLLGIGGTVYAYHRYRQITASIWTLLEMWRKESRIENDE